MKKLVLALAMLAITGALFATPSVSLKVQAAPNSLKAVNSAFNNQAVNKGANTDKKLSGGYVIIVTQYDTTTGEGTITRYRYNSNGDLISVQVTYFTYA
jgi:hypothetical protein